MNFDKPFTPLPKEQLDQVEQDLLRQDTEQPAQQTEQAVKPSMWANTLDPSNPWANAYPPMPKIEVPPVPPRSEWPTYVAKPERELAMKRFPNSTDLEYEQQLYRNTLHFFKEDEAVRRAEQHEEGSRGRLRLTEDERRKRNRDRMRKLREEAPPKLLSQAMLEAKAAVEAAEADLLETSLAHDRAKVALEAAKVELRAVVAREKLAK